MSQRTSVCCRPSGSRKLASASSTCSPLREQPPGKAYIDSNTGDEPKNRYDRSWELTEPGIDTQASYLRLISKFVN